MSLKGFSGKSSKLTQDFSINPPIARPHVKSSKKKRSSNQKKPKKNKKEEKKEKNILYILHVSIFIYFKCDSLFPPFPMKKFYKVLV